MTTKKSAKKEEEWPKASIKDFNKFKKPLEGEDPFTYYTYRKVSGALCWVFYQFRIKAEIVASLSPVLDFIAIYFILMGSVWWAALFMQLAILIDCCDGQLARYYISIGKKKPGKYGEYVDSVVGVIGLGFVVYFIGAQFNVMLGVLGMFTLLMLNLTSAKAGIFSDNKKGIYDVTKKKFLGKIKGRIGLSHDFQRLLVTAALVFHASIFMWIFIILGTTWWASKFWFYRKL
jgi:phosphatidylglycerophosphate synthase